MWTKALSLKAEFPCCPVISVLADKVISLVGSSRRRLRFDEDPGWNAYKLEHAKWLDRPSVVHTSSRLLVERLYGWSINSQISYESAIMRMDKICPLPVPPVCPNDWAHFHEYYGSTARKVDW